MAKLLGPDFVNLLVREVQVSRAFYTELLGLVIDPRFDGPEVIAFDTTTIPLGLRQRPAGAEAPAQPGWGVALWLDCDDVDGLYAQLQAAGVTILTPPSDGPFGRSLVFADPDGYRITANQNPWDQFPLGGSRRAP